MSAVAEVISVGVGSVSVVRGDLLAAVKRANRLIRKQPVRPALGCIRLSFDAPTGKVVLESSDGTTHYRETVWGQVGRDSFECLVDGRGFAKSLESKCKVDTVKLELNDVGFSVVSSAGSATVEMGTLANFPPFPRDVTPDCIGCGQVQLKESNFILPITAMLAAAAKDNGRYAFNGVLMRAYASNSVITLAATDGRRLAVENVNADNVTHDAMQGVIIPAHVLKLALLAVGKHAATIRIGYRLAQHVQIHIELHSKTATNRPAISIQTNLIDGQFPPFEDVIPKNRNSCINVWAADLRLALNAAAENMLEDARGCRLTYWGSDGPDKNRLQVYSNNGTTTYSGTVTVLGPDEPSEPIQIGFNPILLLDAIETAGDGIVSISTESPVRPGVIRIAARPGFTHVLMPVNLKA